MVRGEIPAPFNPPENEPASIVYQRQRIPDHIETILVAKDAAINGLSQLDKTDSVSSLIFDMRNHIQWIKKEFGIGEVAFKVTPIDLDDEITPERKGSLIDFRMSSESEPDFEEDVPDFGNQLFDCMLHVKRREAKQSNKYR